MVSESLFLPAIRAGCRGSRPPFRYKRYADAYLEMAQRYARVSIKQVVISPSALSLLYPPEGVAGYSREEFIEDLLRERETEVRRCLQRGAHNVLLRSAALQNTRPTKVSRYGAPS